jgi:ADP-dependent NAD(P)H-hydrate dehydratase / NAD(P)H-hydrate epimerase
MIKILSAAQIKDWDNMTIQQEPITSVDLMERASRSFVTWFTERFNALNKVGIVCGTGNNGGDGLAIARMLEDWGYPVKLWIVRGSVPESPDFKINLERLKGTKVEMFEIRSESDQGLFSDRDVLLDAVFGYGLSRKAEGIYGQVINCINKSKATRIAIDMPSGLMADKPSTGDIVRADHTVSFQLPKLSFFFPQYHEYVGEWHLLDIGLHKNFIRDATTNYFYLHIKGVKKLIKSRSKFDHKGTFGHALLIAGSYGKMGAAVLSAKAILTSGVGLLTIYAPSCGYNILQTSVPEAMVITDPQEKFLSEGIDFPKATVVGVGPGLGERSETVNVLRKVLESSNKPFVIDADALNILSANREMLQLIKPGSILTPHPKEFERLVGPWKDDFDRLERQKELSRELKSVIVLKGAFTSIAGPDGTVYFNSTGNPGMATGGTGDVLTGFLTGLLAQGYTAMEAAILGVYLHGLSADLGVLEKGMESFIASDLIHFLPTAFRQLKR